MAPRRTFLMLLSAAALSVLTISSADAFGLTGNDTGGMIAWSRDTAPVARDMADAHCAGYGRYAVITSVHRWPGGYIGFACRIPDRWGPHLRR